MHAAVDLTHRPTIEDEAQSIARMDARLSAEGERLRSRPTAELWASRSMKPARRRVSAAKRANPAGGAMLRERAGL